MKRTALTGLFICAVMSVSPVFAAETTPSPKDLCAINLDKINSYLTALPTTSENTLDNLKTARDNALQKQSEGKNQACVDLTSAEVAKISTLKNSQNN